MTNPIKDAVEPQRAAAVAAAVRQANIWVRNFIAQFPVGTDLDLVAPYPSSSKLGRVEYLQARDKYSRAREFLSHEVGKFDFVARRTPMVVTGPNEEAVERYLQQVQKDANLSFDAYVAKLTKKVGECDRATVEGHLWAHSILTVTKGTTVERWKTQQIINVSVLGKLFNQWPTRLLKK